MLSNTCKYAIRSVIYLAFHEQQGIKIGIKKISSDLDIPTPFLGKILQTLARHHILSSTKGPNGGFGLGMAADEIHLMDIVEIIDGVDSFNKCAIGVRYCREQNNLCAMHSRYAKMREELKSIFQTETIDKLVNDIRKGKQSIKI
jgi:Rrf2 family iron-sulfur cluster assembly transcriptional regulator